MVNKWEIHFCCLDPTQGSEQRGTRPVLVVSNDAVNHALPIVTVLPLSSIKQGDRVYPSEVLLPSAITGLPKDSVAMIQQVRTISQSRLTNLAGRLDDEEKQEQVRDVIRAYFEL